MLKSPNRQRQMARARNARWHGTVESRWKKKTETIILFIARLGWATTELVNYYLCQGSQAWPARLQNEGLLFRQKIIIGHQTKHRTKSNGSVATILLLTDAGQRLARSLDGRIGKRILMPSMGQARHDLIAFWTAVYAVRERWDLRDRSNELEIWSDQVMRGFIADADVRPDSSIYENEEPIIHIEVERSKKKTGLEEFKFVRKLRKYTVNKGIETLIITETEGRAKAVIELLNRAETEGVEDHYFNEATRTWFPLKDNKRFRVKALIAIWDHDQKDFTFGHTHNL